MQQQPAGALRAVGGSARSPLEESPAAGRGATPPAREDYDEDDDNDKYGRWRAATFLKWIIVSIVCLWLLGQMALIQASFGAVSGVLKHSPHPETAAEADVVRAYEQWKLIQEKYPNRFDNFSEFLLRGRDREKHLRARLESLSAEKMRLLNDIVVPPAPAQPVYSQEDSYELEWTYLSKEKEWPYVGSDKYLDQFRQGSRSYFNSLAVFPHANRTRLHGLVGIYPNGTKAWRPKGPRPPPIDQWPEGKKEALKDGGFYLALSNWEPLDRDGLDSREKFCHDEEYDLKELDDVSVIITFYNEHPSTLLRSVHSVLNRTPPPLLREIILVDDHSNNTANMPGGYIYEYIRLLPKVKLMRLPERRGLVQARLAGAKLAKAPVLVVLDSHIEVNQVWLEPQLKRLRESPRSVVFPQIMALDSETLEQRTDSGIGCFLSFKWVMQERPYFLPTSSAAPVPSASMAGGLFAVRRDWFFESGAYDEEFAMWGAENVEMAFRVWMCGGRVECTPCARTFHIYRHGGSGYKSPGDFIKKNRLRTARIWLDEWWQVSKHFLDDEGFDMGPLDHMLALKERLKCKPFSWFLENVDPKREGVTLDDFGMMGEIRHEKVCIDNMSEKHAGKDYGLYHCHNQSGSQGWFQMKSTKRIHNMSNENTCLGKDFKLTHCDAKGRDDGWTPNYSKGWMGYKKAGLASLSGVFEDDYDCLGVNDSKKLQWLPCKDGDSSITWSFKEFEKDPNFHLPTISPEYIKQQSWPSWS